MYPSLKEDLNEIVVALRLNKNADWEENDPAEEFENLAQLLEKAINKNRFLDKAVDSLSHYTCGMDAHGEYQSTEDLLDILQKQSEIDGTVSADDIVAMWEPLTDRYTVNELLDQIGL